MPMTLNTNLQAARATTQFTNYAFNSFCNFGGKSIAANAQGLSSLGGDKDKTTVINAYFEPIMSDWGSSYIKQIRFMYFGYEASGDLKLTVTSEDGEEEEYQIPQRKIGQQRYRVAISRRINKRYWVFRISNESGADFSMDAIDAIFILRNHGFSEST
ncbi:hypothetical protein [Chrysiogenes arsenatis]|uniref:hypothetical protein n=1 Tax=Chrysiogenes arsenatis TaxID=309797 RepID=UPI000420CFF1|nr:hypothetical protein [Chrysiogenes arsenatis]